MPYVVLIPMSVLLSIAACADRAAKEEEMLHPYMVLKNMMKEAGKPEELPPHTVRLVVLLDIQVDEGGVPLHADFCHGEVWPKEGALCPGGSEAGRPAMGRRVRTLMRAIGHDLDTVMGLQEVENGH